MTITSDANGVGPSTEAVMAAWLRHAIESAGYHEHLAGGCDGHPEHLAQFYNAVYGDTATGDSFNVNQAVVSSLTASKTCKSCGGDVPRMLRCAGVATRATLIVAWHAAARSRGTSLVRR